MENTRINFYRKWNNVCLEDYGGYVSPDYHKYQMALKRCLKKMAQDMGANLVWFTDGHYFESAMIERGGKYVYISPVNNLSLRSAPSLKRILIRTAEHAKD